MRNSDQMTVEKAHPTLDLILNASIFKHFKAKRFGQMHSIEIPELDKTSYTRFDDSLTKIPQWNTRDISTEWIVNDQNSFILDGEK